MADVLGAFEQAVLMAIVKAGDGAYGRAVLRGVEEGLGRQAAAGAVYATLDRLEKQGLISSDLRAGGEERGGRAKRYYRLTAAGTAAMNESRATLQNLWRLTKWPLEAKP